MIYTMLFGKFWRILYSHFLPRSNHTVVLGDTGVATDETDSQSDSVTVRQTVSQTVRQSDRQSVRQ